MVRMERNNVTENKFLIYELDNDIKVDVILEE